MRDDETIDNLYESSNHGTRREDVVAAYNAGVEEALDVLGKASEKLRREGCGHEATAVERAAEDVAELDRD